MGVSMNLFTFLCLFFLPCRKWREEQNNLLREKDEEETEALKELRETARKELEDWYNHHEDTLKHAKDSNRYL